MKLCYEHTRVRKTGVEILGYEKWSFKNQRHFLLILLLTCLFTLPTFFFVFVDQERALPRGWAYNESAARLVLAFSKRATAGHRRSGSRSPLLSISGFVQRLMTTGRKMLNFHSYGYSLVHRRFSAHIGGRWDVNGRTMTSGCLKQRKYGKEGLIMADNASSDTLLGTVVPDMSDGLMCVSMKAGNAARETSSAEMSPDRPWQCSDDVSETKHPSGSLLTMYFNNSETMNGTGSPSSKPDQRLEVSETTLTPPYSNHASPEIKSDSVETASEAVIEVATETAVEVDVLELPKAEHQRPSLEEPPSKRTCPGEASEDVVGDSLDVISADSSRKGSESAMTKEQYKYASSLLRQLRKHKDARPFNQPVDPVKLNIPTYPTIITNPMDFGTIDKKLSSKQYETVEAFTKDIDLVFTNCFTFNGSENPISVMARNLQTIFDKQIQQMPPADYVPAPKPSKVRKKSLLSDSGFTMNTPVHRTSAITDRPRREIHPPPPRDLPYNETKPHRRKNAAQLQFCRNVIKELQKKTHESYAFPFYHPVDPVALNIPDYYKIVKHPMDMSTIQGKLNNVYSTADEFESDIRQMFRNCYKFNPVGTPVYNMGKRLEAVFNKKWQEKPSEHHTYSSDDSESGSEDVDENEGIALLEKQLAMMSDQLNAMRNKRASIKAKKSGKSKKSSSKKSGYRNEDENLRILSFDQRSELAQKINLLTGSKLDTVLRIMKESMPELEDQTDEIELDIDSMTPRTQSRLWNFVILNQLPNTPIGSTKAKPIVPKKSRTVLSEAEQLRQIRQLERQLSRFENKGNGRGLGSRYVSSRSGTEESSSGSESSSAED
ncbi:hypothetical protein PCK1_001855 [Pneumocystis canis]|nr:hypothetical protein PCK1_001855 [Pneumocystis canis]